MNGRIRVLAERNRREAAASRTERVRFGEQYDDDVVALECNIEDGA